MKALTLKAFFLSSVLLYERTDSTNQTGNFLSPYKSQILSNGTMITLKELNLSVETDFLIFLNFLLNNNAKLQRAFCLL